jgi:predicted deacetylase
MLGGAKFILRLDDACPTMKLSSWQRIEKKLDQYCIKPIVAVIPKNKDTTMFIDPHNEKFWHMVRNWERKGWCIAMHGYTHRYDSSEGGFARLKTQSEFAGIAPQIQEKRILRGYAKLKAVGLSPSVWVAPSHTFDAVTLRALTEKTDIRIISDGWSFRPYLDYDFIWIPQQISWFKSLIFGTWTICIHPNTMLEEDIVKFEKMLDKNFSKFFSLEEILSTSKIKQKNFCDKCFDSYLRFYYSLKARIRGWLR